MLREANEKLHDHSERKIQLEMEVSVLKSNLDLTISSKDKIILNLKNEIRLLQAPPKAMKKPILDGDSSLT